MRPSEAAEILEGIEEFRGNLPEDGLLVEEAVSMAISALKKQEQDRWISVTERLPEDYQHVLVSGEKIVKQAQFIKGMFEMEDGEGYATINSDNIDEPHFYTFKATAWRPLPEPYTEEES